MLFITRSRSRYWQLNLDLLLVLVIIIVPWFQLYTFFHSTKACRKRTSVVLATCLWMGYLYLFHQIKYSSGLDHTWLELGIIRVSVVGISLISILSGVGVVSTPYATWLSYKRNVSDQDYQTAKRTYQQTESMIQEKKGLLDQLQSNRQSTSYEDKGLFSKLKTSFFHPPDELSSLQTEVDQLETLANQMRLDLEELEQSYTKGKYAQTWRGKLWRLIELLFAVYCVYKLIATTVNVILRRTGSSDPITTMISIVLGQFGDSVQINTAFWSQQLSFWFAGIIVVGSIRGFLKLLMRILEVFRWNVTLSISHLLLLTAQIMGMYFLSSILMMQLSLPREYRYLLSSSDEFDFFKSWSDFIFMVSSLVSSVVTYVVYSTHDAKSMAHDFQDVEMMQLESGRHELPYSAYPYEKRL
ncbi:Abscisic acid G-protein coupled receptor-domain-containing protein [Blakeslea trispora]|nr:Abscisic acid G-protein coupled receptor-domain-containing protein [Blakeslea trispora]